MEEWRRQIDRWPDAQFRPADDGPDRIAVFHSNHRRDYERAHLAQSRDGRRYLVEDTLAAKAIQTADHLSVAEKRKLIELVATRTALAATGRVELYCAEGRDDRNFLDYQVAPLLGRESVTHINAVPAPSIFAVSKEQFSDALFASEIVRDKPHLPDWRQPGSFYTGNPFEAKAELTEPQQKLVETFSRDAARDAFAEQARRIAEQQRERQQQRARSGRPERGDEWER